MIFTYDSVAINVHCMTRWIHLLRRWKYHLSVLNKYYQRSNSITSSKHCLWMSLPVQDWPSEDTYWQETPKPNVVVARHPRNRGVNHHVQILERFVIPWETTSLFRALQGATIPVPSSQIPWPSDWPLGWLPGQVTSGHETGGIQSARRPLCCHLEWSSLYHHGAGRMVWPSGGWCVCRWFALKLRLCVSIARSH